MFGAAACLTIFMLCTNILGYTAFSYWLVFAPTIVAFIITFIFGLAVASVLSVCDYIILAERLEKWRELLKDNEN